MLLRVVLPASCRHKHNMMLYSVLLLATRVIKVTIKVAGGW